MESIIKRFAMTAAVVLFAAAAGQLFADDVLLPPTGPDRQPSANEPTEAEIREILVQDSIDRYTGPCACPYHRKWNEKLFRFPNQFRKYPTVRCGADSEYVRPGGPTVFCYGSDVPAAMVEAYREHLRSTFLTEPRPQF